MRPSLTVFKENIQKWRSNWTIEGNDFWRSLEKCGIGYGRFCSGYNADFVHCWEQTKMSVIKVAHKYAIIVVEKAW